VLLNACRLLKAILCKVQLARTLSAIGRIASHRQLVTYSVKPFLRKYKNLTFNMYRSFLPTSFPAYCMMPLAYGVGG
jgi:hypothetical protein